MSCFNATLTSPADTFRFFSGNRFYTTQAVRLTRDLTRVCLTAEARMAGEDPDVVLRSLVSQVKIPKE